jgi:hypothetical protein
LPGQAPVDRSLPAVHRSPVKRPARALKATGRPVKVIDHAEDVVKFKRHPLRRYLRSPDLHQWRAPASQQNSIAPNPGTKLRAMALDASRLLGSPQLAGSRVCSPGFSKTMARTSNPVGFLLPKQHDDYAQTPAFGIMGFLAVTRDELALINFEVGVHKGKLGEVAARIPRSDVASAELGSGLNAPLTITLVSGAQWRFEVSWAFRRGARKLITRLRAPTA